MSIREAISTTIAGAVVNAVESAISQPLVGLIAVLQSKPGHSFQSATAYMKSNGVYRGGVPTALVASMKGGLRWGSCAVSDLVSAHLLPAGFEKNHAIFFKVMNAGVASTVTVSCTSAFENWRILAATGLRGQALWECLSKRGFFHGFEPAFAKEFCSWMVYLTTYGYYLECYARTFAPERPLKMYDKALVAGATGVTSAVMTTALDLFKTRVQAANSLEGVSFWAGLKHVTQQQGLGGFFRIAILKMARSGFYTAVTMVGVEGLCNGLPRMFAPK